MGLCETEKVIDEGYCIGCGACVVVSPRRYDVAIDKKGMMQAFVSDGSKNLIASDISESVCPFTSKSNNETLISSKLFSAASFDIAIGHYDDLWAGHVAEGDYRLNGGSGGMVTWMILELFRLKLIDFVVHVKEGRGRLFEYGVSRSSVEAREQSKSKYYPVTLHGVVDLVKQESGKGLFVGIPCFVKAMRNLCDVDQKLSEKVAYMAGLVCGHLKSSFFAESFGWQLGIQPEKLSRIDFRHMEASHTGAANKYFVKVSGEVGGAMVDRVAQNSSFFGYLWGHGFFKYKACDYCDDIFAETADICFGDAWIKPYVDDPAGDNIVIVRHPELRSVISEGIKFKRLNLQSVTVSQVRQSQDAGLRHRRDGVKARVAFRRFSGHWVPEKRYLDMPYIGSSSIRQKAVYIYREWMSKMSLHFFQVAKEDGEFEKFRLPMRAILFIYNQVRYFPSGKLKRVFRLGKC